MATYAIGDLQGCLAEFDALLRAVKFQPGRDELWLVGDLVNRGPNSLGTLRRIRELGGSVHFVLGNHDLHFLAVYYGGHRVRRSDTLHDLLNAPDVDDIAAWLRAAPLVHYSSQLGWLMVHAGVPPLWSLEELLDRAEQARRFYAADNGPEFFAGMYGNTPACWDDELTGLERVRCIVNYLTRMRLIDSRGELDFELKGVPTDMPPGMAPWFSQPRTKALGARIAFGHWAALEGQTPPEAPVAALDTGCVWGRELTALCLETGVRTAVAAQSQEHSDGAMQRDG